MSGAPKLCAISLAALSVAVLAACKVGPDYRAPTPPAGADAALVSLNGSAESTEPPPDDPSNEALPASALEQPAPVHSRSGHPSLSQPEPGCRTAEPPGRGEPRQSAGLVAPASSMGAFMRARHPQGSLVATGKK